MVVDPKYRVEDEADDAMATCEGRIAGDICLPVKRLSRKARAALKGTLALLSRTPVPTARGPRRKAVSWDSAVAQ